MNDGRDELSGPEGFDLSSGHYIRWQNSQSGGGIGDLDIGWKHPCKDYIPDDFWNHVDVTSGTRHKIINGGPGDEEHLTIEGSLLCLNCRTHGFIENGKWRDA